jgi:hypothetical protein
VGHAIFISYRRDDTEGEAGRLYDDLTRQFGDDCVFMDVAGISPGIDFRKAIEDNVSSCGVLLAMIGPNWVSITTPDGRRRLDDPSDFVGLEIASALKRNVPVIPVLVHDARIPHPDQLPDNLKDLAYRNSVELSHARWNSDTALLITALKAYATPAAKAVETDPVHATVSVQLPAPHPETSATTPPQKSKAGLIAGVVFAALAIAGVLLFSLHPWAKPQSTSPDPGSTQPAPSAANTPASTPVSAPTATTPVQTIPSSSPATSSPGATATETAPLTALQGRWVDQEKRGAESLTMVELSVNKRRLIMHASATCANTSDTCDWGRMPADLDGQNATATFKPNPNREAKITVHPDGPNLDVVVLNTIQEGKALAFKTIHRTFVPAK